MLVSFKIRIHEENLFLLLSSNEMAQFKVLIRDLFKINRSRSRQERLRTLQVSHEDFNIFRAFPLLLYSSVRIIGHDRELPEERREIKVIF